jgi:hypothetical protein
LIARTVVWTICAVLVTLVVGLHVVSWLACAFAFVAVRVGPTVSTVLEAFVAVHVVSRLALALSLIAVHVGPTAPAVLVALVIVHVVP